VSNVTNQPFYIHAADTSACWPSHVSDNKSQTHTDILLLYNH